jgi:uncharacterized membrane protein YagU involved in acid resistance
MSENLEKKQLVLKKSLLKRILFSILLSIITLFIVLHFGKIYGEGGKYSYYHFENPIGDGLYVFCSGEDYLVRVKTFYLPSLFGNWIYIVVLAIIYFLIATFFKKYSIKLK